MNRLSRWLQDEATGYLSLLILIITIARMFQYFWPNTAILKGQNPAVAMVLLSIPILVVVWWCYRPSSRASRSLVLLLLLYVLAFAYEFVLGLTRFELWSYSAIFVPVTIVMVWLKPPSFRAVITSMNVFSLALVGIALLSQLAAGIGIVQSRNYVEHRYFGLKNVDLFYWRWEGPFGNVNFSGPIGAYLLVYGLTRRGGLRLLLMVSGAVFLLASESRSAIFAVGVGVLTWLLCKVRISGVRLNPAVKVGFAFTGLIAVMLSIVVLDPTINGRTEIWSNYLRLWSQTPWFGVGERGIADAMVSGAVIFSGETGHSLFVDTLSRSGIFGLLLTLLVVGAVIVLGWKAHRRGMSTGLILGVTFLAASMGELLTSWLYLSVLLLPLLLAGLMSTSWLDEHPLKESSSNESAASAL